MSATATLDDVLDAAEALDYESRIELVSVLSKRLAETSREHLVERVERAHAEFLAGDFEELTAAEIVARATQ